MTRLRGLADLSPVRIAAGYMLFGGIWILLSDSLVNSLFQRPAVLTQIQTIKGWLFVFLSGLLILGLVRTRELQLQKSRNRLSRASQELHVLHRIYRHNIRNDLNVVRGYLELVRAELDTERLREQINLAHNSTDRILGVSEKLGWIERTNTRASNTDTIDVMNIIEREVESFTSEYPEVTIEIHGRGQKTMIYGDDALSHVVRELLENAVEHYSGSREDCCIDVSIERTMSSVTVEIADNGPGISDYEINALEKGEEGPLNHTSGIGLWLVKWLCTFYDGEVSIGKRPGGGTSVTLILEPSTQIDHVIERAWRDLPVLADA